MTAHPQTWHHGLMAQWWANFSLDAPEAPYFQALIERAGQPALDLCRGTGRVLLPLLQAGLDVDGCDLSPDMLALCSERAAREGFAPHLYEQATHELDLPRRYGTIYICDSFGIGGQRAQDAEGLRCCYQHLAPGGTLVFNHYLPYDSREEWQHWLPEQRVRLPQAWSEPTRRQTANGDEFELRMRIAAFDPLEQRQTREMRITLLRDGTVMAVEERAILLNGYFYYEVLAMLAQAGFTNITVTGAYSDAPLTADDTHVMFVARK